MGLAKGIDGGLFVRALEGPGRLGPTLLWIHGLGESGLCFEGILGHPLLAGLRHLAPDLPGFGLTPGPSEPLGLAAHAEGLARWLERRGEGPVVAVGHSMGGVVATLLAEAFPERLAALVDVDGNLSFGDCTFSSQAAALPLEAFLARGFEAMVRRVEAEGATDPAHGGYATSMRLCDPRAYHLCSLELVELSRAEGLARRLARAPRPACYVAGSPGGASPRSLELLAEAGVPTALVSPAGHWPFIDRPEAFARALLEALAAAGLDGPDGQTDRG